MSLRWSSYVAPNPPTRGSKTQNGWFSSKIALRWKKVCYKVSLCENRQQQSCKAFIGLTIRAEIIGGKRPLLPEILDKTDRPTNRKLHTGFRLVPTSMTLNAVIAFILRFFPPNSVDFQSDYVTVVEDRPIISVKYCIPVPVFHFWTKL